MVALPVVDAHVHFWDPERLAYPWLEGLPALRRSFAPADYRDATAGIDVRGLVFVEADVAPGSALAEVDQVVSLKEEEGRIAAIVAHAPLEEGERVRAHLDRLASRPLVRGVRRLLQGERDPRFCLRDAFVSGVSALAPYGFTFDVCVRHHQLPSVVELARRVETVPIVLDHIGKPDIRAGALDPWRSHIADLARLDHVFCKLSGLATEARPHDWTQEDLAPYVAHVLECFGTDRVLFGSDWPVCTLSTSYARWADTLDLLLGGLTDAERAKVFADNARRFYRLPAPA